MFLTDDEVSQFQAMYRQTFGKEISREDAMERGTKLVRLFEISRKPMTKTDYQKTQQRLKELKKLDIKVGLSDIYNQLEDK